jgi:hypothetical protein
LVQEQKPKLQPILSNGQDVDAARQLLALWTTTSSVWAKMMHQRPTSYDANLADQSLIQPHFFLCFELVPGNELAVYFAKYAILSH